ncbi:hypothetical protein GIX45_07880 [Erwinia sp. CPCC 100877]|nr:hypothetical protein [Erwinia sp. CPCC 100877]
MDLVALFLRCNEAELMEKELVGYYIGDSLQFDILHKKITRYDSKGRPQSFFIMRDTMMRLFLYLLKNACDRVVTTEEILYNVWDLYGLKSSSQRLWQVMQSLRLKLVMHGAPHDFIMRVETINVKGYAIKKECVRHLYLLGEKV